MNKAGNLKALLREMGHFLTPSELPVRPGHVWGGTTGPDRQYPHAGVLLAGTKEDGFLSRGEEQLIQRR